METGGEFERRSRDSCIVGMEGWLRGCEMGALGGTHIRRELRQIVDMYVSNCRNRVVLWGVRTELERPPRSLVVYIVGPASLMKMDHLRLPSFLSLAFPSRTITRQAEKEKERGEERAKERGGKQFCPLLQVGARGARGMRGTKARSVSVPLSLRVLFALPPSFPPFPSASAAHYFMYIFSEAEKRATYQFLVVEAGPRHGARQSGGVALRRHRLKRKR